MPTEKKLRVFKIEDSGTVEEYSIRDSHINLAYGVCSTEEATPAKVVTLTNDPGWELKPGSMISVKFLYPVPVASTLNVDNTGAKVIWQHGTAAVNVIRANDTVQLIYDGTRYSILSIDSASQLRPGEAGGLATLDASGKIPGSQLPSYVDDVLEFANRVDFPVTGESGKIYVDTSSNESYRWSGSTYIRIDDVDEFVGATENTSGSAGLVPAPASGDQHKFLGANGQWNDLDASIDIDTSIPVDGWSATKPYTYTWLNSNVTDGCTVKVYFLTGSEEDDTLFIEFEKVAGGVQFTAPTLPTDPIPVRIHLIYFETGINVQEPTEADRISTGAIHGAVNVEEALTTLDNKFNTKLDKPANIPADRFLRTDADGQAVWAAAASSSEVADAVSDWLSDNITTGQTIALDESLTVAGAAGDAKATGDRLNAFSDATTGIVAVSETQPQSADNRLWIKDEEVEEYSVPTYAEYEALADSLEACVNKGYVENGVAYFMHDGDILFEITGIGGGGGGGGGTSTAVMTCTNTTGWTAGTFAKGAEVTLRLNWSSVDDEITTGDGSLTVEVGESVKALSVKSIVGVAQGDVSVNVGKWMSDGTNVVRLTVTDVDGNARSKTFNIDIQNLTIESSFDDSVVQTGEIAFSYTPWGEVTKTIHFSVDGTELPMVVTTSSGRQLTNGIPAQAHGAHTLDVWFSAEVNENQILSNVLHYDIVCIETGNDIPIISSSYNQSHVSQYSTVVIPYMVYTPGSQVSNVTISLNGNVIQTLPNMDRTMHSFSHRFDDTGSAAIAIVSGSATKTINLTIDPSEISIEPVSENLALYLSARGRSNSEANPAVWTYGEGASQIACTMTRFNFVSNGWVQDDDGVTTLRVNGGASVTIPYQIFKDDFRAGGKTIEIEFATRDVRDYSAVLLDCMSGGRGLRITAQDCRIASEQSGLQTQFKEDEHVRLAFVVDKRRDLRLIRCYVNGILSAVVQYPDNDDFTQINPVNVTISGNGNTVDIYCIRVYDADLTSQQIEENWIADTPDGGLMLERYSRNNVRDAYGQIVTSKLPNDLPYMIITAARLPQYKGDKLICSGRYVDPINPTKNFTFENAQIDVQGTSSQYYSRKNYKVKFNGGFTDDNGNTVSKYALNADAIPVKTFCFKADVASSEGANNVELVRLYEEACPYRTPAQEENHKVRQGIDGFPMVIFWNNPDAGTTTFLGKYNFNNDKSTKDVFGFVDGDESWEIRNNTSNRVVWRSDDYSGKAWLNDFEARYPDTDPVYEDPTQLKEFASWVRSTDPSQATGNTLETPATYPSVVTTYEEHEDIDTGEITYEEVKTTVQVTYNQDTAEYRRAKFRAELEDYAEVDSALFYYLFTELFLMVDSRAKNAFPSFIGSAVSA